ncbi:biotin/lipoyl-binding protein [Thioalkalicoccus limnaeus]|uniref:Biotin/lipoyl-binding protein n=1 Tax=Thioalkalicoccus limnaeus TaxID=120681 RepID=A0ABV4BG25_9GAMM
MNRLLKFFIPVLILALGVGVFQYLQQTRPERPTPEIRERVWRVETERIEPRRLSPTLELYGRVETPDRLQVAAPAAARVLQVAVREGDRVAPGQRLLELDPRDFSHRLAQAQAQVDELQAQIDSDTQRHLGDLAAMEQERALLAIAEDGVARAQRLATQQVGSQTDLDTARQELARQTLAVAQRDTSLADFPARQRALLARLRSAQARLDEIALEIERAQFAAPFRAIIAEVNVTTGDQVRRDDVLLSLYPLASLEVRARIPTPFQEELAASLDQMGYLPASAHVGEQVLPLRLVRFAGDATTSGVDALFRLEGETGLLRAGQMLVVHLERRAVDDAIAVPFGAVYGGERIYRLVDGRMEGVRVRRLGSWYDEHGDERLLVQAPALTAGDELIVTHMPNAIDGLRVEARR